MRAMIDFQLEETNSFFVVRMFRIGCSPDAKVGVFLSIRLWSAGTSEVSPLVHLPNLIDELEGVIVAAFFLFPNATCPDVSVGGSPRSARIFRIPNNDDPSGYFRIREPSNHGK